MPAHRFAVELPPGAEDAGDPAVSWRQEGILPLARAALRANSDFSCERYLLVDPDLCCAVRLRHGWRDTKLLHRVVGLTHEHARGNCVLGPVAVRDPQCDREGNGALGLKSR